ncbi:GEVED domain-containing protein [Flavobacterium sp. XGLA_31]|uniref:Ig-like domain-containing protein n=1 Tax=Flavobacterium sp. XGLA_31 TaxID=3447666 RepID=UPI003F2D14C4
MMNNYNSLHDSSSTSCKRTWREKAVLLLFFVMFSVFGVNAQVTTNGGSGLAGTYGSLASAITALNGATISSPVVITLTGNETAPVGGYNITATGTSTNTITIQGSSSTITAATGLTSGALNDAIFKITGGDWITIQNFTMQENAANTTTTAASNNMTEFGVALFYATTTNGAQNCTIQNNTITLNRTYQNTFGVYSNSTHSATTVTTSATATTTSGGNSGLKVYGNVISNVNMGILVIGPTAIADVNTGIDIGGSSSTTGNTISNFGTTGTFSGYANVSGTVNGILVRNSNGFNVSYNSITSSNGGVTSGTLNGIQIAGASNAPTATFTNNITNNTIALTTGFSGAINGITYPSGSASATSVLNVNNNNFTAATSTVTNSGTIVLISVASTNLTTNINSNTFTNIVSNTTGSFTFMSYSYTMPAGGSQTINGNSIVTAFSKTGAGGTVTGGTSGSSSPNGTFHTFTNNNFSNITVTGATGITGVTNSDGSSSSATRTVTGNTFNNWTGGTSAITAINYNYIGGTTSTISNNTVTNITGQSTVTGINIGSSASLATTLNVANNTISNLTSTGTGSTVTGLSCSNASTTININANAINTLSSTGASAVTALSIGGGATTNVYQNKIYNISGSNASSTVNGILISAGTNVNTYNNTIGDLRASIASGTDVIRGISITSSTATSNQRVYYNTIYLNGTSTGTNFGSSGIFHTYSATATTAALDMRNNIVVNASGANGTGLAVAFRRSAATDLNNYASTSNNNLFYGTSGTFNNGTNYAFGAFQTLVTPRETASKSQNPTFASTTGSAGTFLHFADLAVNLAGANGQAIAGYTTDFDGDTRDASTPDIGADEWNNGTITAPTVSSFSPTNICVQGGQTITLNGTSLDTVTSVLFNGPSGINLAGTITGTPTATSLTVIAPAGVVDGGIIVTNPAGSFDTTSTITFVQAPSPTVGVSSGVTICSGTNTTLTATGGSTYSWTPSLGLNGTTGATVIANPTTTTTYTVTGTSAVGCTATASVTVTVTPSPTAITIAPPASFCTGGVATLTATGGAYSTNKFSDNMDAASTNFTAATVSGTTTTSATLNTTYFAEGTGSVLFNTTGVSSVATYTLNSNVNLSGATTAQLTFSQICATEAGWDYCYIEYSSNGGTTWTTFPTTSYAGTGTLKNSVVSFDKSSYSDWGTAITGTASTPTNALWKTETINIPVAALTSQFKIRFRYTTDSSSNYFGWLIDNVKISSVAPQVVWSPTTNLYTDVAATTAYTGTAASTVYAKLTSAATYTATSTLDSCSATATVTATPNALPTISTNGITICDGGAGAALLATGGTSYSWSPATGLSAANVANPTANPTATTTYTVTGTDANGCQNTATATVTVNNRVIITAQPASAVVLENDPASFSVSATGTGLTYQWEEFDGASWNTLTGETSATYSIASAGASLNTHQYRCIVSGTSPCAPVTSSAAVLTVGNVSITAQPSNQTICSDATATFTVGTTGTVTSYQWQYSTNGGTTWTDVATGGTTDTLVVGSLNATNTGTLYHVVLNGSVTSNSASVTVRDAVVFDTHPLTQAVCSGTNVTFSTLAYGTGVTYQWQMSTNGTTWNNVSGATATSYTLNGVTGALNGTQYRVIATGTSPCSPVTSNVATLTVTDVTVAATATSLCIGASTSLSATFTGAPDYTTATWSSTTGSGAETAVSGTSATVTPTAAGTYVYTFSTNGTCPFTKTVTVTVNALPVISSVTATPAAVCSDASIALTGLSVVSANGTSALGAGGTASSSTGNSIFPGSWGGTKSQYLIKASELTALGYVAGNITSVAFEPTTSGQTYQGFFVSIGTTTATALTTTFLANGTQVYAGTLTDNGFTPVANAVNTLAFGTGSGSASSFAWDGTSNIVLTFSWSRVPSATTATASTMKSDTVGFVCGTYKQADSQTPAAMLAQTTGTTVSVRPRFTLGGVIASNVASSYTWSWNTTPAVTTATGTTSVSNTTGSAITQTFTATATSAAGCTNSMTTSAVTVNSTIPAPTGTDSTQCGTGTPTCSVTGSGRPGNTFHWYTVSTNGTALAGQSASTLSSYPVSANTTFYVSEVSADGLCESPRTAVNVTVTAPYAFTLSTGTMTNCSGSASLTPVTIATNGGYTAYSWSNNGTVSGNETTGWYFSPTTTTTYTVTATGGGCSTTASVVVTPVALPIVTVTPSPAAICVGSSSTLTALTTTVASGTVTIGTGTTLTSATTQPTAFCNRWPSYRMQTVYTAAELQAAGLSAGNITAMAFNITTLGDGATNAGFEVKIGNTTSSTLSGDFVSTASGFTTVYPSQTYTHTASGWQTIPFSTPFAWNGTSNIIVEVIHSGADLTNNSITYYTATTGNTVAYTTTASTNAASFSTNRLNVQFSGQTNTSGVGTLSYSWNGSSTTGNVLTDSPTTTTTYTAYGLNGTTGCIGSASATVTVYNTPSAPTATDGARCSAGVVTTATVADTNGFTTPTFKWYADNVTTTALQSSTSASYTTSISATTTFYVSVVSPGGCESARTPITLTVNTPATLTVSPEATVCTGGSTTLTASGAVSYTWTPALGLNGTTSASVVATPGVTTTYSVNGVDANGCTTAAATVKVNVAPYPATVTITQGAASLCANSVMSLTAAGGNIGGSGSSTLGAGGSTSTSAGVNPFYGGYGGVKTQFLIKASELTALGLSAGNLNSLGLDLTTAGSTLSNLGISVGATSLTALTTNIETGLTSVYSTASFVPAVGINTFNFSTPFAWNGTSNVIISFCWSNANTSNTVSTVKVDAPGFTSSNARYVDSVSATDVCSYTGNTTPSGWNGAATTGTSRPKMVFGYSTVATTPITWSPTTDLYTDAAATTAYTGGAATVVYTKPSGDITYTATASNGACTTSATTTVTPIALPEFTLADATICGGQSATLTATGAGNTYVWSPSTGLSSTTGATVTASPTATTTYTVVGTSVSTNCVNTHTVTVSVNQPVVISGISPTSNSVRPTQSATYTVSATGDSLTYQWQVDNGGGFVDITNDSMYSGATTATLSIADITSDMNGYQYQCVVSGTELCSSATSDPAILNVDSTGIDTQPVSVTACGGGAANFTVAASSDDPEQNASIFYNWEYKVGAGEFQSVVDGFDATTGITFSGSETASLSLTGLSAANTGIVVHAIVNGYIFSSDATLTVKAPVAISAHPADQTVCVAGGTATFSVTATGDNLGYQWQFSTNGTTWSNYTGTGATTASIAIVNPALAANGTQYRVVVSGNAVCGSLTSNAATLYINNPTITSQPAAVTAVRGNTATFTVAASAATSYQWQYATALNGTYTDVVDAAPAGITYGDATTATLSVYTSAAAATGGAKYYRCIVTNNGCTVTSTGALLTLVDYCTSNATNTGDEEIYSVTVNGNSTDSAYSGTNGCTTVAPGAGSLLSQYSNFTSLGSLTSVTRLQNVAFSIAEDECDGATYYSNGAAIWVDFNQDGDFDDAGEKVFVENATTISPRTISGSFAVPLTANLGDTRMRIIVGEGLSGTGLVPCGTYGYGETEDYIITILPAPACDGTPVAGTATASLSSVCYGASTTVALNGTTSGVTGITYQWYYSSNGTTFSAVSGATTSTLSTGSLTADAYYYCTVTCAGSGLTANSNTVTITVSNPQLTGTTPASRCGTGTVTLGATASSGAVVGWYAAATGGTTLATGTSFTTPSIAATTTYYAEANTGVVTAGGLGNTSIPTSTGASAERGIVFTATTSGTIVSAQYYSPTTNVTNTVTVKLVDHATGTQIGSSLSLPIAQGATAGFYTMNLNLPVTAGTTYRLLASFSSSVNRISSGADYSSAAYNNLAPIGTITSGYDSGVSTTSYNYFHNIVARTNGCTSARTAVTATVTPQPTATISYAGTPFCSTAGIGNVTLNGTNAYTGGTFSSTAGLTIDSVTGAIDVAASTPGTYTVTYTTNPIADCGAQTATTTVVINQALTSTFAYDFASYCTNGGTATPTVTGTAGTFTASPAGLSINAATGAITLATSAAGTYTVTNTVVVAGCANSVSTQTVTISTAVAITSQPVSVSKLPTENATFTVAATGTGLTYQWEVNDGSGWAAISGETTNSLTLTAVTSEMNGYQYRVVVSGAGACASVTSSAATLTVSTAAIATNPANYTACSAGANTATFAITTTGDATSFQWQMSTNGTTWTAITNGGNYANADTATLSLSGLTLADNGTQFRCVVNGVVYSNPATLTVKAAVAIGTQPVAATGCSAGGASFSVAATGDGLGYQWQVSTNGTTWSNVSGATSSTLLLTGLTAAMNGYQYQVIVSGAAPCSALTSTPATLTVNTAVAITTQPAATTVCPAANATFTVAATGTSLGYQWQMSTNGTTWSDVSGANASSLVVSGATLAMTGYQYRVVVSGAAPCGAVTSSAAVLTVSQPAAPVITPATATICPGSVQTLTVDGGSVTKYSNSFDTASGFALGGTGSPTAVVNTTYQSEGTGSLRFNTTATSVAATYTMTSNVDLSGLTSSQLTFSHQTLMEGPTTSYDYGYVEYSADGGTTWVTFPTTSYVGTAATAVFTGGNTRFTTKSYPDWITNFTGTGSLPNNTLWKTETFNIPAAALTSQFRLRFRYTTDSSTNYYGWMIDNVKITAPNATVWSPTTGLYTNAGATTAYTGTNLQTVYAKPSSTSTYTVTNTNNFGCTNSATVTVNVNAPSTLGSIAQPLITCSGSQTTFTLTGLVPNSTSTLGYTINGVAQTAITGVVADASGNGSFTVALAAANNGKTLAITTVTRTDVTPNNCATTISANNTVTIAVQPLVTYYADADGDGFGNLAVTQVTCQGQPSGYVTNSTDCDDADPTKHASYPFYVDADGDGFGAGTAVSLCAVNATTPPMAGYSVNGTDCNDADATKHASFSFYVDADGDGYGTGSLVSVCAVDASTPPSGYSLNNTDCNDSDNASHANTTTTSNVTACGSYTWSVNGATYTTSGTYTYVVNSCHTEVLNLTMACSSVVTVKMMIQGYYAGSGAMTPVLANQGVGSSTTDVDNVTIELRDSSTYALVASTTAMLQTNGDAVATFPALSGSYYIAVKHRNAVQTWSANPVAVSGTPTTYDFTTAASQAYGDNMVNLGSGVYGFYSGDLTQDDFVDFSDFTAWETDYNSSAMGNYATDLNGDGFVDFSDFTIWEGNYNGSVYSSHP